VQGTRTIAGVAVSVPTEEANPIPASPPLTLDSDAQLAYSSSVMNAISAAAGHRVTSDDPDLVVTAIPGSRILHIAFTADTEKVATNTANAAASALMAALTQHAVERSAIQLKALRARAASLNSTINADAAVLYRLQAPSIQRLSDVEVRMLRERTHALMLAAQSVKIQTDRVLSRQLTPPQIVQPVSTSPQSDVWRVSIATGLSLGLLLGVLLARFRHLLSPRLHRTSDVARWTDLPLLAVMPSPTQSGGTTAEVDTALRSLEVYRPTAFVCASARSTAQSTPVIRPARAGTAGRPPPVGAGAATRPRGRQVS